MKTLIFITALSLSLSACGVKGPLYYPEENQPQQTQQK